ncbi:unnamed protein product [Protopolystoma xenopodis]|uniref:PDZ domain-containing protein n=1 Tax=Protopolystoma xenopodis TaxID=117903 RepID=A0A3S4ZTW5_9PLAT|nr:unnamed protein product [Protopolystoma xenopodis]
MESSFAIGPLHMTQLPASTRPLKPGRDTEIEINCKDCEGLGVSFIGGSETSLVRLIVNAARLRPAVFPEGAAARDGRLRPGDQLLSVNGVSLSGQPYLIVLECLSQAVAKAVVGQSRAAPITTAANQTSNSHVANAVVAHRSSLASSTPDTTTPPSGGSGSGIGASTPVVTETSQYSVLLLLHRLSEPRDKWYDQEETVELVKKPGRGLGICITGRCCVCREESLDEASLADSEKENAHVGTATGNRVLQKKTDMIRPQQTTVCQHKMGVLISETTAVGSQIYLIHIS